MARTKRVRLATSLIPVRVKGLSPVTLHTHRKPIQTVSFRAVGSSIIVCREIWPNQIANCRQHCEAVLENALEKAVRDPPPPASTSKFDFLYSTLSGRQTKEIARGKCGECGRERKKRKNKIERKKRCISRMCINIVYIREIPRIWDRTERYHFILHEYSLYQQIM